MNRLGWIAIVLIAIGGASLLSHMKKPTQRPIIRWSAATRPFAQELSGQITGFISETARFYLSPEKFDQQFMKGLDDSIAGFVNAKSDWRRRCGSTVPSELTSLDSLIERGSVDILALESAIRATINGVVNHRMGEVTAQKIYAQQVRKLVLQYRQTATDSRILEEEIAALSAELKQRFAAPLFPPLTLLTVVPPTTPPSVPPAEESVSQYDLDTEEASIAAEDYAEYPAIETPPVPTAPKNEPKVRVVDDLTPEEYRALGVTPPKR